MAATLDPVLGHAAAATLGAVLLLAALHKLRDPAVFRATLENYRLLPAGAVAPVAMLLPLLELAAGVLLLPAASRGLGAVLAGVVLLIVTAAVVINLLRGNRRIDCGCGGPGEHLPLSAGVVARNAVLGMLALAAALPASMRPTVGLDIAAAGFATVFALGVYAVANQLLGNQPRLNDLRNQA
jgi:hypothetical protein